MPAGVIASQGDQEESGTPWAECHGERGSPAAGGLLSPEWESPVF